MTGCFRPNATSNFYIHHLPDPIRHHSTKTGRPLCHAKLIYIPLLLPHFSWTCLLGVTSSESPAPAAAIIVQHPEPLRTRVLLKSEERGGEEDEDWRPVEFRCNIYLDTYAEETCPLIVCLKTRCSGAISREGLWDIPGMRPRGLLWTRVP